MQLDERAHQRQAEAGAAVLRTHRVGLEPVEHLILGVGRDAGPAIGDREHHRVGLPLGRQRHGLARRREADRVGQQVEQNLPQAPLVGGETADAGGGADVELQIVLHQPVQHAFGRRVHAGADVDLGEVQRHGAGVDGGEIEDVVDDRQQRVGGNRDVAEIFALLVGERAEGGIVQQIRKADDIGERRT